MSDSELAWGSNGVLTQAFGLDEGETENDEPKEAEPDPEEHESNDKQKFASDDNRYPMENAKEAKRSLERASHNESLDQFEKIAERIVESHPELLNEKLAGLGYSIGQQIGQGIRDALQEDES